MALLCTLYTVTIEKKNAIYTITLLPAVLLFVCDSRPILYIMDNNTHILGLCTYWVLYIGPKYYKLFNTLSWSSSAQQNPLSYLTEGGGGRKALGGQMRIGFIGEDNKRVCVLVDFSRALGGERDGISGFGIQSR